MRNLIILILCLIAYGYASEDDYQEQLRVEAAHAQQIAHSGGLQQW